MILKVRTRAIVGFVGITSTVSVSEHVWRLGNCMYEFERIENAELLVFARIFLSVLQEYLKSIHIKKNLSTTSWLNR